LDAVFKYNVLMTKFGQLITATVIVLLIGGGVYWFMRGENGANPGGLEFDFAQNLKNAGASNTGAGVYENADLGFSFNYPDDFEVKEIDEDNGGFTVLAEGKGEKKIFQVFISSFDEEGPITPERIKKDLPDIKIEQSQKISLAGTDALAFVSPTEERKMTEIWFIRGGILYQVSSFFEFTDTLSQVLASWKFF